MTKKIKPFFEDKKAKPFFSPLNEKEEEPLKPFFRKIGEDIQKQGHKSPTTLKESQNKADFRFKLPRIPLPKFKKLFDRKKRATSNNQKEEFEVAQKQIYSIGTEQEEIIEIYKNLHSCPQYKLFK